ncbi:MAG: anthranilate synthase component I family protein, partial [bacterium]|nr:anthranilate synthase component I family protein [bacterium]
MKDILVEELPYSRPENFLYFIYQFPFSFLMNFNLTKKENYTICGFEPFMIFKSKKENIEVRGKNEIAKYKGSPLNELQKIFNQFNLPLNYFFLPGGFGYLSYDLGWQIESLPNIGIDDLKLPDIFICFYDKIFVFDNFKKKIMVIWCNFEGKMAFEKKINKIKKFLNRYFEKSFSLKPNNPKFFVEKINSNMDYSQYISAIKKIRNYIKEGDVYQINFSHRFEIKGFYEPYQLFYRLQKINPTPYSAFFNFDDFILISNSPELFLKKEGKKIITKPMKGTRKVIGNITIDKKIKEELLSSEKDRAELIMIVDLERNDLGKICEYGTVKVKKLINLEKYKTVYQTTSTIEGILKEGINLENII